MVKLYHYTTSATLVSILNLKQIWLTDFRFLNDTQEGILNYTITQNALNAFNFSSKIGLYNEIIHASEKENYLPSLQEDFFESLIKDLKSNLLSYRKPIDGPESIPYVFSLSENCDSLSQWRAYGNGELCIEFDSELLRQVTGGKLIKIDYKDPMEFDLELSASIERSINGILKVYRETRRFDQQTREKSYQNLVSSILRFQPSMSLKHLGFKDEVEQRLVLEIFPKSKYDKKTFIDGRRYPTPRLKANIYNDNTPLSKVITRVIFGPGSDEVRARYAIEALNYEFDIELKADFSKIPYRT